MSVPDLPEYCKCQAYSSSRLRRGKSGYPRQRRHLDSLLVGPTLEVPPRGTYWPGCTARLDYWTAHTCSLPYKRTPSSQPCSRMRLGGNQWNAVDTKWVADDEDEVHHGK